jgi:DNA primase
MSEDKFASVRSLPLLDVLASLGVTGFKKARDGWHGICPFHKPVKNDGAFRFNSAGLYHCFSCDAKGKGAIDLVMQLKGCGFQEATAWLLPRSAATPYIAPVSEPSISENKPFDGKYEKFYVHSEWLAKRGFTAETLKHFGVGQYHNPARKSAYGGMVMFPIHRFADGVKVGYLGRNITGEGQKYRFPEGFKKSLEVFGAWQLKSLSQRQGPALPLRFGFVVESPLCVMKFHQLGFPAVSPFGAFVSEEQARILSKVAKGWCYLPDRDKFDGIGQSLVLLSRYCWVKAPPLPAGVDDPEWLTREQLVSLLTSLLG